MKTITIYELLGMVKDGKAPKKIKYKDSIYEYYCYEDKVMDYLCHHKNGENKWDSCLSSCIVCKIFNVLNDEVEILDEIKEEKKIPEKLPKSVTDNACSSKDDRLIATTINEIIDYLDCLKSKGE